MRQYFFAIIVAVVCGMAAVSPVYSQDVNTRKLQLAQTYQKDGDLQNAARLYRELYDANKTNPTYFQGLSAVLLELNAFGEAISLYEELLSRTPTLPLKIAFAEVLFRAGRTAPAEKQWKEVLDSPESANNLQMFVAVAEAQIKVRATGMAVTTIERAREQFKNPGLFVNELTQLYGVVGKQDLATAEIIKLYRQSNNLPLVQGRISALILGEGARAKVESTLTKELRNNPNDLLINRLFAAYLRESGQYELAVGVTEKIDQLSNAGGREVLTFAISAQREGYLEAAQAAYQYVISLGVANPNSMQALYGYVRVMEDLLAREETGGGDSSMLGEIEQRYLAIVKDYPGTQFAPQALLRLGIIAEERRNNFSGAEQYYRRVQKEYQGTKQAIEAGMRLVGILVKKDDLERAKELGAEVQRAASPYPDLSNESAFQNAMIAFYKGELEVARKGFEQLSLNSNADIANDALEQVAFFEDNDKEGAEQAVKTFAKAMHLTKQQKTAEAITMYEAAKGMTPDLPLAELSLLRIAKLHAQAGQHPKTRSTVENLMQTYPKTIYGDEALFLAGDAYSAEGDTNQAILTLTRILVEYPASTLLTKTRLRIRTLRGDRTP